MNEPATARATLIAATVFNAPDSTPWRSEDHPGPAERSWDARGQDLIEFAGRACYQSWSRPNPETATNRGYLAHIIDVGHFSTFEHAYATFYLEGVSRSLTHELVRHRHFNYSQVSQRYVDSVTAGYIEPPELEGDEVAHDILEGAMGDAVARYDELLRHLTAKLAAGGVTGTEARKRARQAARAVMPNMTETKIVVTGNYRAWRHFLDMRAAAPADLEIRRLAVDIGWQLMKHAPNAFQDFRVVDLPDGTSALERDTTLR